MPQPSTCPPHLSAGRGVAPGEVTGDLCGQMSASSARPFDTPGRVDAGVWRPPQRRSPGRSGSSDCGARGAALGWPRGAPRSAFLAPLCPRSAAGLSREPRRARTDL